METFSKADWHTRASRGEKVGGKVGGGEPAPALTLTMERYSSVHTKWRELTIGEYIDILLIMI